MNLTVVAAVALSFASISALFLGDPKRRRISGKIAGEHSPGLRWILTTTAVIPGMVLAMLGDSSRLFIWLGACAIFGWLVSNFRSRIQPRS